MQRLFWDYGGTGTRIDQILKRLEQHFLHGEKLGFMQQTFQSVYDQFLEAPEGFF